MTDDYIHRRINEILHQKVMMGAGDEDDDDYDSDDEEEMIPAEIGYRGVSGGYGKPLTKKQYAQRWMKTHDTPKTLAGVLKNKEFNKVWKNLLKKRKVKVPKKAPAKKKVSKRKAPVREPAQKKRKAPTQNVWMNLVKKYTKQGYSLQEISGIYKYMKEGYTERRAVENLFTSK